MGRNRAKKSRRVGCLVCFWMFLDWNGGSIMLCRAENLTIPKKLFRSLLRLLYFISVQIFIVVQVVSIKLFWLLYRAPPVSPKIIFPSYHAHLYKIRHINCSPNVVRQMVALVCHPVKARKHWTRLLNENCSHFTIPHCCEACYDNYP